jgi:hypothetical protein
MDLQVTPAQQAAVEIGQVVRELGVRFGGLNAQRMLVFERVFPETIVADANVLGDRIEHLVAALADHSEIVTEYLKDSSPQGILIT